MSGGQKGQADKAKTQHPSDNLRDVNDGLREHDDRKREDGIEGAVFEIAEFRQRIPLDKSDCHRANIHGTDAKTNRDQ